uniref:Uncharacterized protein n=1 Tax=Steinernema glaseri TaxID=37863 RepID=A0A1I7YL79_9BILA
MSRSSCRCLSADLPVLYGAPLNPSKGMCGSRRQSHLPRSAQAYTPVPDRNVPIPPAVYRHLRHLSAVGKIPQPPHCHHTRRFYDDDNEGSSPPFEKNERRYPNKTTLTSFLRIGANKQKHHRSPR